MLFLLREPSFNTKPILTISVEIKLSSLAWDGKYLYDVCLRAHIIATGFIIQTYVFLLCMECSIHSAILLCPINKQLEGGVAIHPFILITQVSIHIKKLMKVCTPKNYRPTINMLCKKSAIKYCQNITVGFLLQLSNKRLYCSLQNNLITF